MFFSIFFFFFLSLMLFLIMIYFILNNLVIFIEWEVISLNSSMIVMSILFDWMSLLFMSFVLLISSVVIMYSKSYMHLEVNLHRFIILVMLFVMSMMLLIISPNIISILLGWDGLGLVSYCLVIYYQNVKSYNAGMLTVLMNRIGDVCLLMVIAWMLNYGGWNYLFYLEFIFYDYINNMISLLIIMAAMTKSAQIPFSSWLPAAMAAPTPVSALVHSSTLVTAGVYLLIRFNFLLVDTIFFKILLMMSSLTMFMAGISANYEFDLKKIIAFSTLSQLGLMMSILSLGFYDLAFFHLLTHAMFKALLFMCAGMVIHMMNDNQDIRYMGGIGKYIPLTSLCFNISNLALCGIPFLAGFYSKDLILEMVCLSSTNFVIFFLYYVSIGMTMCYTMRLVYYLMIGDYNLISLYNLYDEDYIMLIGMFLLMIMSLVVGSILSWLMFYIPYMIFLPLNLKLLVLLVSIIGGLLGFSLSNMKMYLLNNFFLSYEMSNFFSLMWFLSNLSTYSLIFYSLNFGQKLLKNVDMGWSEIYSGFGMFYIFKKYSAIFQMFYYNNFKIYLYSFFLWIIFMLMMFL
uniref:NADH-ubiquinone oxidoreductase chain 5 n=1 Tax=Tineola bisselliella TaxID=93883 RepID=A0A076EBF4_TINBI|nr:NADH dehydrogenase subunit 5 [Tineola bisselliella]